MDVASLAPVRPMQRRGARLGGLLGAAAVLTLGLNFGAVSFALTGGSSSFGASPSSSLESAVTRRASPYYSNEDRERLLRARTDKRIALREKQSHAPTGPDYNKLPGVEEIYKKDVTPGTLMTIPLAAASATRTTSSSRTTRN
ncbi:unnamed protein product [Polarella glacialis]|uniref:Uncharacterized protein n=1 Tax=Polarella glacialis TaxID=89957 RepID=A0A813KY55_POLGL|nr:unnamed protein product [Polarella glacialis]